MRRSHLLLFILLMPSTLGAARDPLKILWDISKVPFCDSSGCYRPSDAYSVAAGWLESDGWKIHETTLGVLQEPLNDYGVVVISELSSWHGPKYSSTEVGALSTFVTNGGGLLVTLESQNSPWRCDEAEPVARAFGVSCAPGGNDYGGTVSLLTAHPIFEGVDHVYLELASALTTKSPSTVAARFQSNAPVPLVSVANPGRTGRVVIMGDSLQFGNTITAGYYSGEPERPFLESTLCWLSNACTGPAPSIVSTPKIVCAPVGVTISFNVTAQRPDGGPLTLSATKIPPAATFPVVTGAGTITSTFTWTPQSSDLTDFKGVVTFAATALETPLRSAQTQTPIDLEATAPITSQPQPVSICSGGSASFTVSGGFAWQWQQSTDDGDTWVDVAGATSSTWNTPAQTSSSIVRCLVTASCGTTASNAPRLTVVTAPGSPGNSLRAAKSGPSLALSWSAATGATDYVIDRCTFAGAACTPSEVSSSTGKSAIAATSSPNEWWRVDARNACGSNP